MLIPFASLCTLVAAMPALGPICPSSVSFPSFPTSDGLALVGAASVTGEVLRLTPASAGQAGAAWTEDPVSLVNGFRVDFSFRFDGQADGIAFVVQSAGPAAVGDSGSGMGYQGIPWSLAVELDTFSFGPPFEFDGPHVAVHTQGETENSAADFAALGHAVLPIDLFDGEPHDMRIVYVPGSLRVYVDDFQTPRLSLNVDLQNLNGSNILDANGCAWIGFTGATGGAAATQDVLSWTLEPLDGPCAADFEMESFEAASLNLAGSAAVTDGGELRLTENASGQAGAAYYGSKASIANGFTTEFVFRIDGTADGVAFIVQNDSPAALGESGSGMGYTGIAASLAIEIDTFSFGPPEFDEDHIAVHTRGLEPNSSDTDAALAHAVLPVDVNDGVARRVRIVYVPGAMDIYFDHMDVPILQLEIDLEDLLGASILDQTGCAWVGFTGATGGATATQSILSWSFTSGEPGCVPPDLVEFPAPATLRAGGRLELSALGVGTGPLFYQWLRDGEPLEDGGNISGANSPTLVIDPIARADAGHYDIQITNDCGGVGTGVDVVVRCRADWTLDGAVNSTDISAFITSWLNSLQTGNPVADFNGDGFVNSSDISAFITAWLADLQGC